MPKSLAKVINKKTQEVALVAKAFNGRCITAWLSDCLLVAVGSNPGHEELIMTSSAMLLE